MNPTGPSAAASTCIPAALTSPRAVHVNIHHLLPSRIQDSSHAYGAPYSGKHESALHLLPGTHQHDQTLHWQGEGYPFHEWPSSTGSPPPNAAHPSPRYRPPTRDIFLPKKIEDVRKWIDARHRLPLYVYIPRPPRNIQVTSLQSSK